MEGTKTYPAFHPESGSGAALPLTLEHPEAGRCGAGSVRAAGTSGAPPAAEPGAELPPLLGNKPAGRSH